DRLEDAAGRYIVYSKSTFPKDLTLDGVRVVVDAAHGAAYRVAPDVFTELGAEVTALGCRPNGQNINRNCGALHPEHVVKEVVRRKAHVGIALDGDADRVIIVDERGEIVDGDAVMALCATRMLKEGRLTKGTLVATVMSNMGLEHAMRRAGGKLVRTAVGDRYVVEEMRSAGYSLGGEQSGHLIFSDHATTGDGVVAALQVLGIMVREQKPLSELSTVMERMPQVLESAMFPTRRPIEEMSELFRHMGAAEQKLGDRGRILVRWSGTEPKLRVMLEGPDVGILEELAKDLLGAARRDLAAAG
ncbi:MAG TPA: phosphoglucosamine mutase, partial [Polyangiaceae bacterium]|nr:phosphoglucosamine mutase [Polyangiaceae bacterium]